MSIRRLHDLGRSGWWALAVLIPFATVILLLLTGQREANAFGPPPPANPHGLWAVATLLPAAILALYFHMVEINAELKRPGAPGTVGAPSAPAEGQPSGSAPPPRLPRYQ